MAEVLVGCSGFGYEDWVGPFYPEGTPKSRFLEYYAERFPILELNVSFYRIPSPRTAEGWAKRTPEGFLFAIKANRLLTHETDAPEAAGAVPEFIRSIEPVAQAGKLACVLLQFPQRFRPSDAARELLEKRIEELRPYPLVCEFRHCEWLRASVAGWLRRRGVGWCAVDEPDLEDLMPREALLTSDLGYVRFHGRNSAKWYEHEESWERYNYLYSRDELREWVEPVRKMATEAKRVIVFMNNHRSGQAPQNAETFRDLLGGTE
jgi:uncharacterized protein YecE (DUF72 family)